MESFTTIRWTCSARRVRTPSAVSIASDAAVNARRRPVIRVPSLVVTRSVSPGRTSFSTNARVGCAGCPYAIAGDSNEPSRIDPDIFMMLSIQEGEISGSIGSKVLGIAFGWKNDSNRCPSLDPAPSGGRCRQRACGRKVVKVHILFFRTSNQIQRPRHVDASASES